MLDEEKAAYLRKEFVVLGLLHNDVVRLYNEGGLLYAPWPLKIFYKVTPEGMLYSDGLCKPVVRKLDKNGYAKIQTYLVFNPHTRHWQSRMDYYKKQSKPN